jgi:regulation of enolase protein 1 (concanavalin A-like superfamily)
MDWLNPPPEWGEERGVLTVMTGDRTDFWRKTHYGFVRDDGHFRHVAAPADFSAAVTFRGDYHALYDQAGIMLRLDERNWIKAGIEFVARRRMLRSKDPMVACPDLI